MSRRKGGNRLLSSFHRKKRLQNEYKLGYINDLEFPDYNPYGNNSDVSHWNEKVAYENYMRKRLRKHAARDEKGRFKSTLLIECQDLF